MAGDPVSWLLIEPGWDVVARDGTEVGKVEEIVGDTGKDIFNGLSIATGLLAKPKYVPSERVRTITEGRAELDLSAEEVDGAGRARPPAPVRAVPRGLVEVTHSARIRARFARSSPLRLRWGGGRVRLV